MNTTLKGDIFEKRVFDLLNELLENDEFYLSRKHSEIFSKKGYLSERRKSNIIFDITIESYIPNAEHYSHLTVFECKDLNKNVSVDDIEEFESKLRQVGEHDTKGIMVSTKGFAKRTINIAKSLKIGLLKIHSNNQLDWINFRKDKFKQKIEFENNDSESFLASVNNKVLTNLADLLLELKIIDTYTHKEKYINIPYLTEKRIEEIVERLYTYDIHENYCLNTQKLCQFIESKYPAKFEFENLNDDILGKIEFNPLKISVDKDLEENRLRFTLCHEIGHLILHGKLLENSIDKKEDNDYSLSLKYYVSDMSNRRLEIQANIFASHLLIPLNPLLKEVSKYFITERIHKNYLYLDNQPVNRLLVFNLLNKLSTKFKASNESIKIRLIALNLLKDKTNFSFKQLLKNRTR
tara:strand:- start:44 stop:1267 length:1224 start_codon:yes stop_codon:yes gene_type:complete